MEEFSLPFKPEIFTLFSLTLWSDSLSRAKWPLRKCILGWRRNCKAQVALFLKGEKAFLYRHVRTVVLWEVLAIPRAHGWWRRRPFSKFPESDFEWKTKEFHKISVAETVPVKWSVSSFTRKVLPVIRLSSISGWCSLFTAKVNNKPCWATKAFPLREHALLWALFIIMDWHLSQWRWGLLTRDGNLSLHQLFVLLSASQP